MFALSCSSRLLAVLIAEPDHAAASDSEARGMPESAWGIELVMESPMAEAW